MSTNDARAESEGERILRVYRSYMPSVRERWDPSNVGNQLMEEERWRVLRTLLRRRGYLPLDGLRILDVGCGSGNVLGRFLDWGAEARLCVGMDLIPERIEETRRRYPGVTFACGNAERLDARDGHFDLVLAATVFSSIRGNSAAVAAEIERVLKPGGAAVWYDARYSNPFNPHVHGVSRRTLRRLFPRLCFDLVTVTVLPPLVRRFGRWTPAAYALLGRVPVLRTHHLGLLVKEPAPLRSSTANCRGASPRSGERPEHTSASAEAEDDIGPSTV